MLFFQGAEQFSGLGTKLFKKKFFLDHPIVELPSFHLISYPFSCSVRLGIGREEIPQRSSSLFQILTID